LRKRETLTFCRATGPRPYQTQKNIVKYTKKKNSLPARKKQWWVWNINLAKIGQERSFKEAEKALREITKRIVIFTGSRGLGDVLQRQGESMRRAYLAEKPWKAPGTPFFWSVWSSLISQLLIRKKSFNCTHYMENARKDSSCAFSYSRLLIRLR